MNFSLNGFYPEEKLNLSNKTTQPNIILKSFHNTFLSANSDGSIKLASYAKEEERWTKIKYSDNVYYLKSYHGTYLRANPNGSVDLAPHAKSWERWTIVY